MKNLLHVDGPVMTFFGQIANFIIVSFLWLLCCVPLITIGASTSALYYVSLKLVRGELSGVARPFFKALKENLKQGILFTLIFGAVGAVLYFDYAVMSQLSGALGMAFRAIFMAMGFCYLITMCYTFPLQAQFVNTIGGTLKNAFLFSIRHIKTSLLLLVFHAIPIALLFIPTAILYSVLPLVLLLLPGLIAYLSSLQLVKVFQPFMENTEQAS